MAKKINRDLVILHRIAEKQQELLSDIQYYNITTSADLKPNVQRGTNPQVRKSVRRGMVQTVGDIFELTRGLTDATRAKLSVNTAIIKAFRNTATHKYDVLTHEMVLAYLQHCTNKNIMSNVTELIDELASWQQKQ